MPDQSSVTEDDIRKRAEANGLSIEERYVPGMAKGLERTREALAKLDPAALRDIEPAVIFRAKG